MKLETKNWWQKGQGFVTNCSVFNCLVAWLIWLPIEICYYVIVIIICVICIVFIVLLVKTIIKGNLAYCCKIVKEVIVLICTFPRYAWAFVVSYILGTPFRPPIESDGASKDLGD